MTTARTRTRAHAQRGFTLIELMVAMVVSALLIGMILSIFTRMSMAYRAQQNIAELQQTLAAAEEMIQRDARQAGSQLPDGFRWAGTDPWVTTQPLQILDNVDGFGPDTVRIYYADATAQARVPDNVAPNSTQALPSFTAVAVDDADNFVAGDLAVLVTPDMDSTKQPNGADWWHHHACVVHITAIAGNLFSLDTAPPWGSPDNDQCDDARKYLGNGAMLYRFTARAYRIDPNRRSLAVLQMSPTGALVADDWQDLGVGFTDLQVATRWNDWWADQPPNPPKEVDTDDLDDSDLTEWYSGSAQDLLSQPIIAPENQPAPAPAPATLLYHRPVPAEIRITLVARTLKKVDAIPTAATPLLTDPDRVDNNDVGNRAAVTLEGVPDAARPAELRGDAVYRHATMGSDLRNLAVGQ